MPADLSQNSLTGSAELPTEAIIFGCTAVMREVHHKIDHFLDSDLPVLVCGECGTGKELIARFLHARSNRHDAPFVRVSCGAVPCNLLEIELFGQEKVSPSGAIETKQGLVEVAESGVLFLDEIEELDWKLQSRLLRLLQDGRYTRVGGREERVAQVRIICTASVDLQAAVEQCTFRQDLLYRISPICLRLAALRDRLEDIPQLCEYFLQKLAKKFGKSAPHLTPAVIRLLGQWRWPGNLRELENWIARVIILGDETILGSELGSQVAAMNGADSQPSRSFHLKEASRQATSAAAQAAILRVLQANHWNRRKTAEELNMSYRSLLYKLRDAGIPQRRRHHKGFTSLE